MYIMTLTWWDFLAVFQYNVILECAGDAGCQAVECVHVCVWLMSVRVCPKVLGDSREQCGCLRFPDGLYCGGTWYVFLRKGPSRPFSPSYATDPPLPLHPLTPAPLGTPLIKLIALTVQQRRIELDRAFPCSVLCFYQMNTLYVLHACIMYSDFCEK